MKSLKMAIKLQKHQNDFFINDASSLSINKIHLSITTNTKFQHSVEIIAPVFQLSKMKELTLFVLIQLPYQAFQHVLLKNITIILIHEI